MADLRLGLVASLAVLAHEVPHHIGDLAVMRMTSANRRAALVKVSLAGAVTALGGLTGWWLVDRLHDYLPYFLVVASSSFIYVALADLIPQLQRRLSAMRDGGADLLAAGRHRAGHGCEQPGPRALAKPASDRSAQRCCHGHEHRQQDRQPDAIA